MKCFYHGADLDGECSGAIVKKAYAEAECIPVDYGDEVPWGELCPNEKVFVVDFSWDAEVMLRLHRVSRLVWIDHHITAINACVGLRLGGLQEVGRAACELTWEYLFGHLRKAPLAVWLLGRYDVWDESNPRWRSEILPFQLGMRLHDASPDRQMDFWTYYLGQNGHELVEATRKNGEVILKSQMQEERESALRTAFDAVLPGVAGLPDLRVCAMVTNRKGSRQFEAVFDPVRHDAMCALTLMPGGWTVSLYAPEYHGPVDLYATEYGGGGHARACGFRCVGFPLMQVGPLGSGGTTGGGAE